VNLFIIPGFFVASCMYVNVFVWTVDACL